MDERVEAGKKLLGQHTVQAPRMSFETATEKLTNFFAANQSVTPEQLATAVANDVEIQDAAIAYLKFRFTPLDLSKANLTPSAAQKAGAVALGIVGMMNQAHRSEFLNEVVFNVAHPANQAALASGLLAAVPAQELEAALLQRLKSGNELHINNALHIPSEIFGRKKDYALSATTLQEIGKAAGALRQNPKLNLLVKMALDSLKY